MVNDLHQYKQILSNKTDKKYPKLSSNIPSDLELWTFISATVPLPLDDQLLIHLGAALNLCLKELSHY